MKVFNLRCQFGHDFEGWFGSSEDFDRQRQNHLLSCPLCESTNVERLPSAPRLNFGAQAPKPQPVSPQTDQSDGKVGPTQGSMANLHPEQLNWMRAVRELTEKVLSNTENVGDRFAEEARRIHYREAPERGIRGTTTPEQRQDLAEEGIPVLSLPALPIFKDTLH